MRTRGFTLIELMVSMALFGLIAAGAMSLVLSGARMQAHSSRVDVTQTALRTAVDFITRDVLSASACASSGNITTTTTDPAFDYTASHNNVTSGAPYATNTDILEFYTVDGSAVGQVALPVTGTSTSLAVTMEKNATSSILVPTFYPSRLQLCDLTNAAVVDLVSSTGGPTPNLTVSAPPLSFPANTAYVMPSRHVKYYVSDTEFSAPHATTANSSMLMMQVNGGTAQPLAEGVEDMQVAYGFDDDGNGVVTDSQSTTDEWLYNFPGDSIGTHAIANLRSIRITLIVKATSVDTGQQNLPGRPQAEDRAAASGTDGFVRRVLRTEIAVRNFNLTPVGP